MRVWARRARRARPAWFASVQFGRCDDGLRRKELQPMRWASYYEELLISRCGTTEAQNNADADKASEEAKPGSSGDARLRAMLKVKAQVFTFEPARLQP